MFVLSWSLGQESPETRVLRHAPKPEWAKELSVADDHSLTQKRRQLLDPRVVQSSGLREFGVAVLSLTSSRWARVSGAGLRVEGAKKPPQSCKEVQSTTETHGGVNSQGRPLNPKATSTPPLLPR